MAKKTVGKSSQADKRALKEFGDKVREIREKKNLSVYDITGEDMPVKTRQHWQAIENAKKNITLVTAIKIARTLDVRIAVLLEGLE